MGLQTSSCRFWNFCNKTPTKWHKIKLNFKENSSKNKIKKQAHPCSILVKWTRKYFKNLINTDIYSYKEVKECTWIMNALWGRPTELPLGIMMSFHLVTMASICVQKGGRGQRRPQNCIYTLQCWIEATWLLFGTCLLFESCYFHKYEPCVLFGSIVFYNEPWVLFGLCWVLSEPCVDKIPNSRQGSVY